MALGEFFGANPLEEAFKNIMASGTFRKLSPDKINGPYFKVYNKRPRFKIPKDE